ncbi:MAG TPA: hypothetical protein PLK30_18550 [Blastocatellia bacterium]|nr:hypothetical protein [Blastocatellia bacterium]
MFLVRTLCLICCLTVAALAQGRLANSNSDTSYAQFDLKEISTHATELEGRRIVVIAEIISVSADQKALVVFDNNTKTLVNVSLVQLTKSQRHTLVSDPIHRVSVYGRVEMKNGHAAIKADQVMPLATNVLAANE